MEKVVIQLKDQANTSLDFTREKINMFAENGYLEVHDSTGLIFVSGTENVLFASKTKA